jgi:NAD(P)-dependent dehydrogenase (short-subunit alcohol dehydrogenase family)
MTRVALVTGATQGLGLALARGLVERLTSDDVIYLTGRDGGRLAEAAAGVTGARTELLDVGNEKNVTDLAATIEQRHGGIDILFSNAYSRVLPGDDPAQVITRYADVNNLGTTRVLRAFGPLLREGGRLLVVSSTLGTLHYLAPVLHSRFDDLPSLEDVDNAVLTWRDAVIDGSAVAQAWPAFLNIPSKIAQVAAVRTYARDRRERDLATGTLVAAVCPGMIDTGTSRPWFDMSRAQTPDEAAGPLLDLALRPDTKSDHYGQLIRFGKVLPWRP